MSCKQLLPFIISLNRNSSLVVVLIDIIEHVYLSEDVCSKTPSLHNCLFNVLQSSSRMVVFPELLCDFFLKLSEILWLIVHN